MTLRTVPVVCVSLCAGVVGAAKAQTAELARDMFAAEFRLAGQDRKVEALAWRTGQVIFVSPETLADLGLTSSADAHSDSAATSADPSEVAVPLSAVPGLTYSFDEGQQAVIITCDSRCYPHQTLSGREVAKKLPLSEGRGGFLNADLVASYIDGGPNGISEQYAGQFEMGLFRPGGNGLTSWTIGAGEHAEAIRLESSWTVDNPESHTRLRLGDSVVVDSTAGVPFRFGGIQFGTDYSIDPTFATFPTKSFQGEAAMPSSIDLYIDGALRMRNRVDAGPFSIDDAPSVAGSGNAQVVIKDALGREHTISIPFYTSPSLLRAGLSSYSFASGFERHNFSVASNDYDDLFAAGTYRRGLTNWLTAGGSAQVSKALNGFGADLSLSNDLLGQLDLAAAVSDGDDGSGSMSKVGYSRLGRRFNFGVDAFVTTENFRRIGEDKEPPKSQANANIGYDFGALGVFSLNTTYREERGARPIRTYGFTYGSRLIGEGTLGLTALLVDDGSNKESTTVGLTYGLQFNGGLNGSAFTNRKDGSPSGGARMQYSPISGRGLGWRAGFDSGDSGRIEASVTSRENLYEGEVSYNKVGGGNGVRAQLATGVAWVDGAVLWSGPVRQSFAVVDVGVPNVQVLRERNLVGRTNEKGRIFVSNLRPYEDNLISIDLNDLPMSADVQVEEMGVRPGPRTGAVVRFPLGLGDGAEVKVVDRVGDALPAGTILVRDGDDARFPVGSDGRVYISGVQGKTVLRVAGPVGCEAEIQPSALKASDALRCVGTLLARADTAVEPREGDTPLATGPAATKAPLRLRGRLAELDSPLKPSSDAIYNQIGLRIGRRGA